jgi:hypothetical protein
MNRILIGRQLSPLCNSIDLPCVPGYLSRYLESLNHSLHQREEYCRLLNSRQLSMSIRA